MIRKWIIKTAAVTVFMLGFYIYTSNVSASAASWCGLLAAPISTSTPPRTTDCLAGQNYSSSALMNLRGLSGNALKQQFINDIDNYYNNGNADSTHSYNQVAGAKYIITNTFGLPLNNWKPTINDSSVTMSIVSHDFSKNTAYDPSSNSVLQYPDTDTAEALRIRTSTFIAYIKLDCGNPLDDPSGTLPDWSLTGHSRVNGNSSATVPTTGTNVTFTHWVHNNADDTAHSITRTVEGKYTGKNGFNYTRFQCSASGVNEGASPCSLPSNTSDIAGHDDSSTQTVTYAFPASAAAGDKYCEHVVYTEATGPGSGDDASTGVCVTYTPSNYDPIPHASLDPNCAAPRVNDLGDDNDGGQGVAYIVNAFPGSADANGNGVIDNGEDADANGDGYPDNGYRIASGRGSGSFDLNYPTPPNNTGWFLTIFIININSSGQDTFPGSQYLKSGWSGVCYGATCTVNVHPIPTAAPSLPGGGVIRNQDFQLDVSLTNTGQTPLNGNFGVNFNNSDSNSNGGYDWNQPGGFPGYRSNQVVPRGETRYYTINVPGDINGHSPFHAPNDLSGPRTIHFYADNVGNWPIGPECPVGITTYERFEVSVNTNFVGVNWEDPSPAINYNMIGSNSGPTINSNSSTWLTRNGSTVDGPHPGNHNYGANVKDGEFSYPYPVTVNKDRFCADGRVDKGRGWVGPAGVAAGYLPATPPTNCQDIKNKPFFKVYGSSISTGGDFRSYNSSCTGGGELAAWFNDSYAGNDYRFGASTQLSTLGLLTTTGVGSNQSTYTNPATDLSLANSGAGVDVTGGDRSYSPSLGGSYADPASFVHCLTNPDPENAQAMSGSSFGTSSDGTYSVAGPNAKFRLDQSTIGLGKNVSLYVDGDVYINGDITLSGANSVNDWNSGNVPSFVLHATGNIYIAPGVKTLDGWYIAQATNKNNGMIFTCGDYNSGTFRGVPKDQLYGTCNNQLTVHGSFTARRVHLMRTYGSLRDEKPIVANPAVTQLGTGAVGFTRWTCPVSGQQWNHWYQVLSSPAQPGQPSCSSSWYNGAPEQTMGYVMPSNRVGQDGSERLCYHGNVRWDAAGTGSDFLYYTTNNNCNSGDATVGAAQSTNSSASGAPLKAVYSTTLDGRHFYTVSYNEAGATAIAFYIYQNADAGALTTIATNVTPPNLGALACSNAAVGGKSSARQTCAAEVFDFSPEVYLGNPSSGHLNLSTGLWDSITSLPPVL